jgi:hypothetical protein
MQVQTADDALSELTVKVTESSVARVDVTLLSPMHFAPLGRKTDWGKRLSHFPHE